MSILELFDYVFVDNKAEKTLFLLHGTGGSKNDFLFLDEALHKKFNLVGLAGNVDENGMRRFFKRLAPGVFDQESVTSESEKLQRFFANWITIHQISIENTWFLGYSNGANILLAMLFKHSDIMRNIVLLHAMLPFEIEQGTVDLTGRKIFVSLGKNDPMVEEAAQKKLVEVLELCSAELTTKIYSSGHELHREEIQDVITFLS